MKAGLMPHDHSCNDPLCGCGTGCGHDHGPRPPVAQPVRPWRPRDHIRAIAIAIFEREGQILAGPVYDDKGQIKGWRPLGGGIEFGERAEDTLSRELREETGQGITNLTQIGVLQNLFDHEGSQGHEVVFVFTARFENETLYEADQLAFVEGDSAETAKWISLEKARAGRLNLFPDGLIDLL